MWINHVSTWDIVDKTFNILSEMNEIFDHQDKLFISWITINLLGKLGLTPGITWINRIGTWKTVDGIYSLLG